MGLNKAFIKKYCESFFFSTKSFLAINFFGLLIAMIMWLISILGLHLNLAINSILLTIIFCCITTTILFITLYRNQVGEVDWAIFLLFFIVLINFSAVYSVFSFPPFVWDEVAYGAALPKLYAIRGYFYYVAEYGPYSAFPQNLEAISTISLILFGSFDFVKVLNFFLAVGLLLISYNLSLLIGLPRIFAIVGALMLGLSPAFITFVPTVKNDIANGFFQSAAILMLILYSKEKSYVNASFMAIFTATAIGIKYNSLLFSTCPILIFIWITLTSADTYRCQIMKITQTGILLLVISCPWYLNNFILFQNPIYPIANQFFGSMNQFHEGYSQLFRESFYGDVNFSWANGSILAFFRRFAIEFNPIILIVGLVGMVRGLLFHKNKQDLYLSLATLGSICLTIRFGFWEPRYSFVLLVMLSVQFAGVVGCVYQMVAKYRNGRIGMIFVLALCILLIIVFSRGLAKKIYGDRSSYYKVHSEESFLEKYVAGYVVARWLNDNTEQNSVVGVWGHQMFFYLNRLYFHVHPLTESGNLLGVNSEREFYEFLVAKKINYLCLADWRFDEVPNRTPGLKGFFLRLNNWTNALEAQGKLIQIKKIDGSTIYLLNK